MGKYKGQEAETYDMIVRKCAFCSGAGRRDWLPSIEGMYKRFNPTKLNDIQRILEKYTGSEAAMYLALCDKYIPQLKAEDEPMFEVDVSRG